MPHLYMLLRRSPVAAINLLIFLIESADYDMGECAARGCSVGNLPRSNGALALFPHGRVPGTSHLQKPDLRRPL